VHLPRFLRPAVALGLIALFLLHTVGQLPLSAVDGLERRLYDLRLRLTAPGGLDDRVVIADIDEKSLAVLGHWPWNRDKLATLMDTLFVHYDVAAVGFDVVFAEPDSDAGLGVLRELASGPLRGDAGFQREFRRRAPLLDYDRLFADSLAGRAVVMGIVFGQDPAVQRNSLPPPLFSVPPEMAQQLLLPEPQGHVAALDVLQEKAHSAGFFDNPNVDDDGIYRRVPLLQRHGNDIYPSLALASVRAMLGEDAPVDLDAVDYGGGRLAIEGVLVGATYVPTDAESNVLVPYRGKAGSFPYLSIVDLLEKRIPAEELAGRIVLVGTSAPGLLDLRSTPLANKYPGVEVHANVIAGILDGNIRSQPQWTLGVEFMLLVVTGLLLAFLAPRLAPLMQVLLTVGLGALVVVINLAAWNGGIVIPLAATLVLLLALFTWQMSYGYFVEASGKRQITRLFGQYVPPELVDEMAQDPDSVSLEGQSRELTVLFSDVRSFTTISEGLSPKALSELMNAYLTPMTRIIHAHRGTIDKYMGDAIMAFWGAPVDDPEHAHHAIEAALEMKEELKRIGEDFKARGWPALKIGIGLNTGTMSVGNMGSEFRMAYTVLGDAVNLGSRLEGLSKQYGATIVVSEFTRAACPGYVYRPLDCVRVKGKAEPVHIFEPVGREAELDATARELNSRFEQAIAHYQAQRWDEAAAVLDALERDGFDNPMLLGLYRERIAAFREQPPGADWDGVFTYTTK
jgi:adenylate cyclase